MAKSAPVTPPAKTTVPPPPKTPAPDSLALTCRLLLADDVCKKLDALGQGAVVLAASNNDEIVCGAVWFACRAGFLDADTLASVYGNSPQCGELTQCCASFASAGHDVLAADCRLYSDSADETACKARMDGYHAQGECLR